MVLFQNPPELPLISISAARAAYVGPGLDLAPHRSAVATLAIALEASFTLRFPSSLDVEEDAARVIALIPPNVVHHLRAAGPMAFVYLDPLSDDHRRLLALDLEAAATRLRAAAARNALEWGVDALCEVVGVPVRPIPDSRFSSAIRQLDERPQDFKSVRDAASLACLSPSRFQARFVETVGVPFRRYRLWRRMALVLRTLSRTGSLTEAAHAAGFSSSAHLSTSFRTMFGLSPSRLVQLRVRVEIAAGPVCRATVG